MEDIKKYLFFRTEDSQTLYVLMKYLKNTIIIKHTLKLKQYHSVQNY